MIPRKQIGFSNEENLLWEISRQLDRAFVVMRTSGTITTTTSTSSTTSSTTTTTTTLFCENCVEATVVIGTQTWQKCNLNVTTYRNGDVIPFASNETEWINYAIAGTGAWCYYDYNPANEPIYGKLYNRAAVNDVRGLAPLGQHIPTTAEFNTLITFLGGIGIAGGKMKQEGLCRWLSPNTGATNESGFVGLPGGANFYGTFAELQTYGIWWSSTSLITNVNEVIYITYDTTNVIISASFDSEGHSVRCLID
jgi:uncharacterized protein (TIGR02145 family)